MTKEQLIQKFEEYAFEIIEKFAELTDTPLQELMDGLIYVRFEDDEGNIAVIIKVKGKEIMSCEIDKDNYCNFDFSVPMQYREEYQIKIDAIVNTFKNVN